MCMISLFINQIGRIKEEVMKKGIRKLSRKTFILYECITCSLGNKTHNGSFKKPPYYYQPLQTVTILLISDLPTKAVLFIG